MSIAKTFGTLGNSGDFVSESSASVQHQLSSSAGGISGSCPKLPIADSASLVASLPPADLRHFYWSI